MNIQKHGDAPDLITVPNLSSSELVAEVERRLGLVDSLATRDCRTWNFILDERGKTYQAHTWITIERQTSSEVREHFQALGAGGNFAAFLTWIMKHDPWGYWTSIPNEDYRLLDGSVPFFSRDHKQRMIDFNHIDNGWDESDFFVAFREIKDDTPSE